MKKVISLIILTISIHFVACDETKKVIDVAGNVQLSGVYNVIIVGETKVKGDAITITFTALDKMIKGNAGCNSYFGKYSLELYALSFSDIGATEQYCDEAIMTVENAYMNALRDTGSYDIKNGLLTLYSKNDRAVLVKANKQQTQEN